MSATPWNTIVGGSPARTCCSGDNCCASPAGQREGHRDADHLRNLTLDAFTTRAEVSHLETHLVFEHVRKPGLPRLVEPGA